MDFLKKQAKVEDEIFTFQISDKTTKSVTDFYREKPFPHYNKKDNKASLLHSGDSNFLAKIFKQFVGFNKNILEIGCGTGQLSIYFAIRLEIYLAIISSKKMPKLLGKHLAG